jgi:hypothetical protein
MSGGTAIMGGADPADFAGTEVDPSEAISPEDLDKMYNTISEQAADAAAARAPAALTGMSMDAAVDVAEGAATLGSL